MASRGGQASEASLATVKQRLVTRANRIRRAESSRRWELDRIFESSAIAPVSTVARRDENVSTDSGQKKDEAQYPVRQDRPRISGGVTRGLTSFREVIRDAKGAKEVSYMVRPMEQKIRGGWLGRPFGEVLRFR